MTNLIADTHCHTIASNHAFSTITENAQYAASIGLKALAITDHGPALPDAPHPWYFPSMLENIPTELFGVRILRGIEANILDFEGTLDLDEHTLSKLEWVIASIHTGVCPRGSVQDLTNAYLQVAKNPNVDVIGHSGLEHYKYNYKTLIPLFKEYGKLVEINQNTFKVRKSSIDNCMEIAKLCKQFQVPIVVNSDSHFAQKIGKAEDAFQMLKEIDFPDSLIVNTSWDRFQKYLPSHQK